ncbi:hypothetical protein HK097_011065 [Rhizophlyctis rosea]|uniref:Methionyl-tRNA formyltransferase, mitochondrial n=1 Tax=Rhizophlyctis rosea TaxID=64517 RepID=A0AAD5SHV6_9FUNG|nr:hypothetical protein HK097_011065 [Rhizophlyctis rosea]
MFPTASYVYAVRRSVLFKRPIPTCFSQRHYNILFFGSDEFAIASLRRLLQEKDTRLDSGEKLVSAVEVVTPPDSRTGAGGGGIEAPLKKFALQNDLRVHVAPPKTLRGWKPPQLETPPGNVPFEVAIVVSFRYFLPADLIKTFSAGAFNVHPSLLPRCRGAAPIQHTILNGDTETGVSIIELHHDQFDAGRILLQTHMKISDRVFYKELHDRLAEEGAENLVTVLKNLKYHRENAKVQDEAHVTSAPKISKDMGEVDWESLTMEQIFARHRAIGTKVPLRTTYNNKPVELVTLLDPSTDLHRHEIPSKLPDVPPGTIHIRKNDPYLHVKCADGWIGITKLRFKTRHTFEMKDFYNGYQPKSGKSRFVFAEKDASGDEQKAKCVPKGLNP